MFLNFHTFFNCLSHRIRRQLKKSGERTPTFGFTDLENNLILKQINNEKSMNIVSPTVFHQINSCNY